MVASCSGAGQIQAVCLGQSFYIGQIDGDAVKINLRDRKIPSGLENIRPRWYGGRRARISRSAAGVHAERIIAVAIVLVRIIVLGNSAGDHIMRQAVKTDAVI